MQLAILAAVLAALAHSDSAALPPVGGLAWRLLLAATAVLVAPLTALIGSRRLVHDMADGAEGERLQERLSRLQALAVFVWLMAVAVTLFLVRWPQIVRGNWALAEWPLVDELAILAPVIIPLVLLWAVFYRLERAGQVGAFRQRGEDAPKSRLLGYVWLHARHHLGLIVLPALAVVGVQELFAASGFELDSSAWWFGLPIMLTALILMPALVRRIWRTTPLPAGPLREELEGVCRARGCPVRDLLIWHTEGYVANAAVVGLSRWLRYVLLTDGLIARLPAAEVSAVLRHELGHLRRHHLPWRLALLGLPLAWWLAVEAAWPGTEQHVEQSLAFMGIPPVLMTSALVPLSMLAYAVVVVGWYSRLLEHEADLEACTADTGQFDPQSAEDFRRALIRILGRERTSLFSRWLHPTLEARLQFLRALAADPPHGASFRRRLRWIAAIWVLLYALAAAMALM